MVSAQPHRFASICIIIPVTIFLRRAALHGSVIPLNLFNRGAWILAGLFLVNKNLFRRLMYSFIAVILAGISIISSILLSFSADVARIRSANPSLLTNLILFFLKLKKIV